MGTEALMLRSGVPSFVAGAKEDLLKDEEVMER